MFYKETRSLEQSLNPTNTAKYLQTLYLPGDSSFNVTALLVASIRPTALTSSGLKYEEAIVLM